HGFEQRRLCPRRGAIYLISQEDMGEHRPFMKMELLIALAEHRHPDNVRGQQVRGELNALELGVNRARESLGQSRLASPRKVLQQNMSATGQSGQEFACGLSLALHNP